MTTTDLTVIDRKTGEVLDLRNASVERLAVFDQDVDELIAELRDAKAAVLRELTRRLDRDANWTQRVPDPRAPGAAQFEITASSPNAGTTVYPPRTLERELQGLLARGTISEAGATKALVRCLTLELLVPWTADPEDLAAQVRQAQQIEVAGVPVAVVKAEGKRASKIAGVNALLKVPGTAAALTRARMTEPAGDRLAKVKVKTKASA